MTFSRTHPIPSVRRDHPRGAARGRPRPPRQGRGVAGPPPIGGLYRQDPHAHAGSSLPRTPPAPHGTSHHSARTASPVGQHEHLSIPLASHHIAEKRGKKKERKREEEKRARTTTTRRRPHAMPVPGSARRSPQPTVPTYDRPAINAGLFRQDFPRPRAPPRAMRRTPYRRDERGLPDRTISDVAQIKIVKETL